MLEPYGFNHAVLASVEDLLDSDRTVSGKRFESDTHVLMAGRGELTVIPREENPDPSRHLSDTRAPLTHGDDFMPVPGPGTYHICGRMFRVEEMERTKDMPLKHPEGVLQFDADRLRFPFALRRWRQGDWFVPFGMKGKKKVSDLFTDLKYGAVQKGISVMVIDTMTEGMAESQHVASIACVRIDVRYKISDSTDSIIKITEII
jgi:tRNA(Ile)-lysidine synthase